MKNQNMLNFSVFLCLFLVLPFSCSGKKNFEAPKATTVNQVDDDSKNKQTETESKNNNSVIDKNKELEQSRLRDVEKQNRKDQQLAEEQKEIERIQKFEMDEQKNPTEGIICTQDMIKHQRYCSDCAQIILRIKRQKSDDQWKCTLFTELSWGLGDHLGTADCSLELLRSVAEKWKLKTIKDDEIVGTIKHKINDQKEHEATFQVRWDYKDKPSEVKPLYMNCSEADVKQKGYETWTAFE